MPTMDPKLIALGRESSSDQPKSEKQDTVIEFHEENMQLLGTNIFVVMATS